MSMVWIAGQTLGGSVSVAEFLSIPQTFTHLQVRVFAKTGGTGAFDSISMTFNGAAGEARHDIYGTGSAIGSSGIGQSFFAYVGGTAQFGVAVIDILDYTNTNKTKVARSICGVDNNGSGLAAFTSGIETSTTAISSLTLTAQVPNFAAGSRFDLYGISSSSVTGA